MSNIDNENIPDETIDNNQKSDVWYSVLSLEAEFREVIILYYYVGFRVKEISQVLHIPSGTVKSRLKRAREKLEVMLS